MFRTNNRRVIPQLIEDEFSFATSELIRLCREVDRDHGPRGTRIQGRACQPEEDEDEGVDNERKDQTVDRHFNAQDVLTLELPELLDTIGSLISESSHFESRFEDARENEFEFVDADFCARGEVPMELDADG